MSQRSRPVPIHVGSIPPSDWDDIERQQVEAGDKASQWLTDKRRPRFARGDIDWSKHGLEPRWVGDDTVACAAAINPSQFPDQGAAEFERFVLGARKRQDQALVVNIIGSLDRPTKRNIFDRHSAGAPLIGFDCSVSGEQIGLGSRLSLAPHLDGADKDLARRIQNRAEKLPAWALSISSETRSGPGAGTTLTQPIGHLQPLVVTDLDEPVAAVWTDPDNTQRVYFVPVGTSPDTILNWLAVQAFGEFAPSALRASRSPEPYRRALPTNAEAKATEALSLFDQEVAPQRMALLESVSEAHEAADSIRHDLLFGTGQPLADAVARVLRDAGINVNFIDRMLGRTSNADLLAEFNGRRALLEVKSASGMPSEKLYDDLQSHLREWPTTAGTTVDGGALIVNHQCRREPEEREPAPYRRQEFLAAQACPVLSSAWLLDAWRTEDWHRITFEIFGIPNDVDPQRPLSVFKRR